MGQRHLEIAGCYNLPVKLPSYPSLKGAFGLYNSSLHLKYSGTGPFGEDQA